MLQVRAGCKFHSKWVLKQKQNKKLAAAKYFSIFEQRIKWNIKKKATSNDCILNITQSLFALQYWIQKDRCLVLVATAGSATTGTLELPAFGAHIGPREGRNHSLLNGSSQRPTYQTVSSSWRLEMKVHIVSVLGVAVGGSRSFSKMPVHLSGITGSCLQRRQVLELSWKPLMKQLIQGPNK